MLATCIYMQGVAWGLKPRSLEWNAVFRAILTVYHLWYGHKANSAPRRPICPKCCECLGVRGDEIIANFALEIIHDSLNQRYQCQKWGPRLGSALLKMAVFHQTIHRDKLRYCQRTCTNGLCCQHTVSSDLFLGFQLESKIPRGKDRINYSKWPPLIS